MAFQDAFQRTAFQGGAFQLGTSITSTRVLQMPVDYVLAGQQHLPTEIGREYDIRPRNLRTSGKTMRSGVKAFGPKPSFTVTSTKRGYD